jgi:hypothetical protein
VLQLIAIAKVSANGLVFSSFSLQKEYELFFIDLLSMSTIYQKTKVRKKTRTDAQETATAAKLILSINLLHQFSRTKKGISIALMRMPSQDYDYVVQAREARIRNQIDTKQGRTREAKRESRSVTIDHGPH